MDTRTYQLNDPDAVAAKVAALGGPRIVPGECSGQAAADGVTISWAVADGKITVSILSKPWLISENTVWSHVEAVLGPPLP